MLKDNSEFDLVTQKVYSLPFSFVKKTIKSDEDWRRNVRDIKRKV